VCFGDDRSLSFNSKSAALGRPLSSAPWRPGIPPQHSEDGEQCPPQSVGSLVRYDSEDDADHDTDKRHKISYPKRHLLLPGEVKSQYDRRWDSSRAGSDRGIQGSAMKKSPTPADHSFLNERAAGKFHRQSDTASSTRLHQAPSSNLDELRSFDIPITGFRAAEGRLGGSGHAASARQGHGNNKNQRSHPISPEAGSIGRNF